MMRLIIGLVFTAALAANGFGQTESFFQTIAGKWKGTLEYSDYQSGKRVTLNVLIKIEPSADGTSAKFSTIYDDFGKVYRASSVEKIDVAAKKYFDDKQEFSIESFRGGEIVLTGRSIDGNTIERVRKTITFGRDTLTLLKETRDPWQFRNAYTLKRVSDDAVKPIELSRQQMLDDLSVLKRSLTAFHPGLYRYNSPQQTDRNFGIAVEKIRPSMPESEFLVIVSQLLSTLDCGHTFVNYYNQNDALRKRMFEGRNYLPFYFDVVGRRFIVTANASSAALPAGSEILSINSIPVEKIINKLLSVTRADGTNTAGHRLDSLALKRSEAERYALFDWYFPLFFPMRDEVLELSVIPAGKQAPKSINVLAMTKQERTDEMARRIGPTPNYDDEWKFEVRPDGIGYLKIGHFLTWRLKTIKFDKFLADAFATLKQKNVQDLVIDIRGNGGGSMDPGYQIARYLADKKLPPYGESRRLVRNVSAEPELARYISTYDNLLLNAVKNGLGTGLYRKFDESYFEILGGENYPEVLPYPDSFTGRTFVITDAGNASAAFQFVDFVQKNRLATTVGQPTGGNKQGINGGNYLFLSLPNSAIKVDIPMYFQSPLRPAADEGVVPDILVNRLPEDIGNRVDREMAEVVKLIGR